MERAMRGLAAICFLWGMFASGPAGAVTIAYQAVDLPDTALGQDLWQYQYTVGGTFQQFAGFNVIFPSASYDGLDPAPASPNGDWQVQTIPVDQTLPADGIYSTTALVGSPALANAFVIDFLWSGAGRPGPQSFEVVDQNFNVTTTGGTAPIPEPSTLLLLLAGGAGALVLRKRLRW